MPVTGTLISGSPVPASGGNVYYEVSIENTYPVPLDLDVWHDVVYEGLDTLTVVRRFITQFLPGWTIHRPDLSLPVTGNWPGGSYESIICAGIYPEQIWGDDSFNWEKEGSADLDFDFEVHLPVANFLDQSDIIATESVVSDRFDVIEAYPNPFNPMTTIRFTLSQDEKVLLSIYDLNGRLVETLVDGNRAAGMHDVTFDASHLASGIYLSRFSAGDQTINGKMILIK